MDSRARSADENSGTADRLYVERLYKEHSRVIASYIARITGYGDHVEDILHETFIVAFKRLETFDQERSTARNWLYGIASNLCRHHKRSRFRFASFKERFAKSEMVKPATRPDE